MKLTILFFSLFREYLGVDKIELDFNNPVSLREVLDFIDSRFNGKLSKLILNRDGSLRSDVHIVVNMNRINPMDSSKIILSDGDVIAILPAPAGG
ncbi:MAG: MoaD/ThiS family protein [Candidatus Methanomethylicia archaeon]